MTTPKSPLLRAKEGRLHGLDQVCLVAPAGTIGGRVQAFRSSGRNYEDDAP